MKVLVIFDINSDMLMDAVSKTNLESDFEGTIESAIEQELGWVQQSGIFARDVICEDSLEPNDMDLGTMIRNLIQE